MTQSGPQSTDADLNYFICTLGQAAAINETDPHAFHTINDFIDLQANRFPHSPAVGFPAPKAESENEWCSTIFSKLCILHVKPGNGGEGGEHPH